MLSFSLYDLNAKIIWVIEVIDIYWKIRGNLWEIRRSAIWTEVRFWQIWDQVRKIKYCQVHLTAIALLWFYASWISTLTRSNKPRHIAALSSSSLLSEPPLHSHFFSNLTSIYSGKMSASPYLIFLPLMYLDHLLSSIRWPSWLSLNFRRVILRSGLDNFSDYVLYDYWQWSWSNLQLIPSIFSSNRHHYPPIFIALTWTLQYLLVTFELTQPANFVL